MVPIDYSENDGICNILKNYGFLNSELEFYECYDFRNSGIEF